MKTKMFLIAALLGAAALTATAGVRFGVSIGFPAPVVYAAPFQPLPVTVVQTVPPCPAAGYVWVAGVGSNPPTGRAWVSGAWHYRSTSVTYDNDRHDARNWHDGYDRDNRHDRDGYHR